MCPETFVTSFEWSEEFHRIGAKFCTECIVISAKYCAVSIVLLLFWASGSHVHKVRRPVYVTVVGNVTDVQEK